MISHDPIRNLALYGIGVLLYTACSPDIADGLSDNEFYLIQMEGPRIISWYLGLQHVGMIDQAYWLPADFDTHFKNDVLPELAVLRNRSVAREYFRSELMKVLVDPEALNKLYQPGGDTYSDMIDRALQQA